MLERTLTKVQYAETVDLNQSSNTALLSFVAAKPIIIHRFGVVADSANGLLAATRLKMRETPIETGTEADLSGTTLNPDGSVSRGNGVWKMPDSRIKVSAGDKVTVSVETAAGGTSTGLVFLEYEELPFAGTEVSNMSESA